MYKKILVPLDGSGGARAAADQAAKIAGLVGAEIQLLYVMQPVYDPLALAGMMTPNPQLHEHLKSAQEQIRAASGEMLDKVKGELEKAGVKITVKIVTGNAAVEISREAREGNFDLIVMGSRGLGEIKGILLGSVSNKVVTSAPCQVLIVR